MSERVEEVTKMILNDIKNSRYQREMPKKELIMLITKHTQSPYGYFNKLCVCNYIVENNNNVITIISTDYKEDNNEPNNDNNTA